MFAGLGTLARGAGTGLKAGLTGNFMRSAAGARGYMGGLAAGQFLRTSTGMGMATGMGLGGLYGAMSDNTSVLGGALTGGLLGTGMGRYGMAGMRATRGVGAGMGLGAHARAAGSAFRRGAMGQLRNDRVALTGMGSSLFSNMQGNVIQGLGKARSWF